MSEIADSSLCLSVVVPTCRRPQALARCLAGLEEQTLPAAELEVIVVDDAGRSHPESVASVLDDLVASGKVGAVGVSNHSVAQTEALA